MVKKLKLTKVQFWIDTELKKELDMFAHGMSMATADLYKGGALMLKNMIERPPEVVLNLFTRSFKDLEESRMKKKILEAYKGSTTIH